MQLLRYWALAVFAFKIGQENVGESLYTVIALLPAAVRRLPYLLYSLLP